MPEKLLENAKLYRDSFGFSVIPLLKNKRPAIEWKNFQDRKPTDQELEQWFSDQSDKMIGIVTGNISGITVIDMDSEEARISLAGILPDDFNTLSVKTPRGYHYYCSYKEGLRNKARILDGVDIRGEGGYVVAPPSVNESGQSYEWIGDIRTKLMPIPDALLTLQFNIIDLVGANNDEMFIQGRRDEDLFHVANTLVRGGMDTNEIYQVVHALAVACRPPFPSSDVALKVKSAVERGIRRDRNLTEEVRQWVMNSSGAFLSSDIARCLQLSSREDLKNLSHILSRLRDDGLIERYGNRAGMFRRIERNYEIMEWQNASINPWSILYPLGLHNICNTYSKNIIVVAGIKDSGKTTFMLDFIKRNQHRYNIHYFTNEMGVEELKLRLTLHKDMPIDGWKFKAYETGGAWEDMIQPNDITIIDYMEVNDAFYQIGDTIKRMHEKLDDGILLLGLQKAKGAWLGRGKEFSLQRPRLYVTLDSGIATLVSVKNPKPGLGVNPVGYVCQYAIEDGWQIVPKSKWKSPE